MRHITDKLILRILASDDTHDVAVTVGNWIERNMDAMDSEERDTEIRVTIGLDTE